MKKILLLSNSTIQGENYLEWAKSYISDFLSDKNVNRVLFIPYAGVKYNWDDYEAKVAEFFKSFGKDFLLYSESFSQGFGFPLTIRFEGKYFPSSIVDPVSPRRYVSRIPLNR